MVRKPFTHVDKAGKLRMVDVSKKRATRRSAEASCYVRTTVDLAALPRDEHGVEPVHAARLAGVQAAKQTSSLIPLCHPLSLDDIQVDVTTSERGLEVASSVVTVHHTGVEMEALTACMVAALSLVSALKKSDPGASIEDLALLRKSGGRSGDWGRLVAPKPTSA
ncbi:MAG TPA: cyclic pyranopterin monophosphate synthase MoaC [Acidimicrobiales bacterium]|nr:cyclic pyranopterin monophosphate synthase MoaC [Acidimicrobiales bacterium]